MTIEEEGVQFLNDGALTITLTAPNGVATTLYSRPGDTGQNFINTTFSDLATESILQGTAPYSNGPYQPLNPLANLDGSQVNGTYRLTITDNVKNNTATLVNWSITVNSSAPVFVEQNGAAMDQNADGTSDENPLATPFTGLTPGDVYAVPARPIRAGCLWSESALDPSAAFQSEHPAFDRPWSADFEYPGGRHDGYSEHIMWCSTVRLKRLT